MLGHGAGILLVDVLWGELHIDHRGLNLCVPHQLHERRQADAGAHHVGGKGMTKPVGVGLGHAGGATMMAEQGAQPGGCHARFRERAL